MAPPSGIIPDDESSQRSATSSRSILGQSDAGPSSVAGAIQLAPSMRLSKANNGAKMNVFSDVDGGAVEDGERGEWADMGTRDGRKKENTVESTPWKGETLPQRAFTPRTPKLEVFRDSVSTWSCLSSLIEISGRQRRRESGGRGILETTSGSKRSRTAQIQSSAQLRHNITVFGITYAPCTTLFA